MTPTRARPPGKGGRGDATGDVRHGRTYSTTASRRPPSTDYLRAHAAWHQNGGIDRLLPRLDGVRETGPGRWTARCPAHDDRSPSLAIRETSDGTILLHDFAGCGAGDIMAAVGLALRDLFPRPLPDRGPLRPSERYVPRDVLACLAGECLTVAIMAGRIERGETLTEDDMQAIIRTCDRLYAAVQAVAP